MPFDDAPGRVRPRLSKVPLRATRPPDLDSRCAADIQPTKVEWLLARPDAESIPALRGTRHRQEPAAGTGSRTGGYRSACQRRLEVNRMAGADTEDG
jgi:hypothetical protein